MKIQHVHNNQYFKGLDYTKALDFHVEKYIKPCLGELKTLSEKADIYLASRWNPDIQTAVLEYAVKPITTATNDNVLRWSILGTGYNMLSKDSVINKISSAIKNIKNL